MRMRALCTETSSIIESGRAKYTYSKMQGVCSRRLGALPREQLAARGDHHRLARRDVAHALEAEHVERDRFGRDRVFVVPAGVSRLPSTSGRMPCGSRNATRPRPSTVRDDRVAALARGGCTPSTAANAASGVSASCVSQLVREHVEQHFGVGLGVDVAAVLFEHLAPQRVGVDQVAVVRQRDAERRVDVERLRLVRAFGAGGRIAAVADADAACRAAASRPRRTRRAPGRCPCARAACCRRRWRCRPRPGRGAAARSGRRRAAPRRQSWPTIPTMPHMVMCPA